MKLEGLKINFLGDSITEGHGASLPENFFWKRFERDGCICRGYGIGGTRIAEQQVPYDERMDQYFASRVDSMEKDADVVVIFGGTNDYGHGDATYSLSLAFNSGGETFEEVFDGANDNSQVKANIMTPGQDVVGMLAASENLDFYRLDLDSSGRVKFVVSSPDMSIYRFKLLNVTGSDLFNQQVERPSGALSTTLNKSLDLIAGTYYICIEKCWSQSGLYTLSNSFNPANESKAVVESVSDMNDSTDTADLIVSGQEYLAQIADNEECDYYEFIMKNKGKPHLKLSGDMKAINVKVYNTSGNEVWSSFDERATGVSIDSESSNELEIGNYYLKIVKSSTNTGNYRFTLTLPERQNQKGDVLSDAKGNVYKITSATTVTYVKPKNKNQTSVKVPNTVTLNKVKYKVTAISAKAFKDNKKLTTLTVGKNVATIGDSALQGAVKLKKLDLSKTNVKTIGKNAVNGCKALTDLKINGNKVKTIKTGALKSGNKKRTITILAKNQKTFDTVVNKAVKAGAAKKSCKMKKSSK